MLIIFNYFILLKSFTALGKLLLWKLLLGKLRILLHGENAVIGKLLLGKLVTVEVSVGEISGWGNFCWRSVTM